MWSLERCKSFWFVEERQGKENAINLQLWQKVPQKQLNNFPVTLETEFTPQQTGKLPAITTLEKSTSLDKTSISVCCSSFNVIPVIHHEQYWIWNGILLPNPKDPEFYYQTCRYNQRLGYLLMVQKSSAICQVWFPLIPLPTHKSESPGLRHRNRSQVNTWIHGINLPPPDRRKARTATMLQAGSGRQSFPPDSEQHHTGNSGISLISFTRPESRCCSLPNLSAELRANSGNWPPRDLLDQLFPPRSSTPRLSTHIQTARIWS